jgi:hypothetical protein
VLQAVQLIPASATSVSVTEPGAQTAQATVEALLYCPEPQDVHVVPDTLVSVSVIEPAGQAAQATVEAAL